MKLEDLLNDRDLSRRVTRKTLFFITFTCVLIFGLFHLEFVFSILLGGVSLMGPFFIGIAIAFVLNVFVKLYEERIFGFLTRRGNKVWLKMKRGVSVLLALVTIVLALTGIILYVVPELINSVSVLTKYVNENAPIFIQQVTNWVNQMMAEFSLTQEQMEAVKRIDWGQLISQATQITSNFMTGLFSATMGFASGVIGLIMSFIFAIYMLFSKEKLIKNLKRCLYAFLPKKAAYGAVRVGTLSNRIFSGFVAGQLTEAVIIGALCYLGMSVLRLPYALLIGVIISLTSLVPVFGAYIGGGVGAFILFIVEPMNALWFLIFLVALQQFEGNIIYPRVVGTSIGLPGIWVMLAILVCGDLLGIGGILVGVPTFSVLYTLLRAETVRRLNKKNITTEQILSGKVDGITEAVLDDEIVDGLLEGDPIPEEKEAEKKK